MLVLALDTATDVVSAAAWRDGVVLGERSMKPRQHAAQAALLLLDDVLEAAGVAVRDAEAIAVGTGPGSYTGLRVGIAAARGLGLALGIPVAGVSTLAALREVAGSAAFAVIDARRGEVFAEGPGVPAAAVPPGDLARRLPRGAVCVGDGALRHRGLLEAAGATVPADEDPRHVPSAAAIARLAAEAGLATPSDPLYLRAPDAEARAA